MEKKITKNSFLIYDDYKQHFELLQTADEVKDLLFAIFDYHKDGKAPTLTPMAQMAFSFMKANMDRDSDAYKKICHRNQVNGNKGGRPIKPKKPSGLIDNPKNPVEPKKPDTDNGIDTGTDKDTVIKEKKFELFWEVYPKRNGKKVGKVTTTQLFMKFSLKDIDRLIANAKNYGLGNDYPKDPERFLKKDFWKEWDTPQESTDNNTEDEAYIVTPTKEEMEKANRAYDAQKEKEDLF
jgi:hypothetical protein